MCRLGADVESVLRAVFVVAPGGGGRAPSFMKPALRCHLGTSRLVSFSSPHLLTSSLR